MNLTELKSWVTAQLEKPGNDFINWQEISSHITKDQLNLAQQIIALFNDFNKFGTTNNSKIKSAYKALKNTYSF
jgi:phage-related minor tail protein